MTDYLKLADEADAKAKDCREHGHDSQPSPNPYRPTDCDYHVDWFDEVRPRNIALLEAANLIERLERAVRELVAQGIKSCDEWEQIHTRHGDTVRRLINERDEARADVLRALLHGVLND